MTVAGTATLGEGQSLKTVAESAALREGLLVIVLLLGQLPSPVSLITRFLFKTCSLISPFFLPSCLGIPHYYMSIQQKPVTSASTLDLIHKLTARV